MARNSGETNAEVCKRLLKQGGYLLVVGGGVNAFKVNNPQIIKWDDYDQEHEHKTVPRNTRGIAFNRFVSHATAGRLRTAAKQLNIPLFPMLGTRDLKELIMEVAQEEVTPTMDEGVVEIPPAPPEPEHPSILMSEDILRSIKRGEIVGILDKHLNLEAETNASEARRLLKVLKDEYGIRSNEGSMAQAILKYKRDKATGKGKPAKEKGVSGAKGATSEFDEMERLLRDTKAAISLILESFPRIKKEVEQVRKKQAQLRALLGDDV